MVPSSVIDEVKEQDTSQGGKKRKMKVNKGAGRTITNWFENISPGSM